MTKKDIIPKIIAMYLPQFHTIPENDEFWGKGFTDWQTIKRAKPLFKGHKQPIIPLNHNYYDLSTKEAVEGQCQLAFKYGIYAFGVYHYWFNDDKNLLAKPAEILRDLSTIKTKYFFTWDNCSWVRSWSNVSGNDWSPLADSNVEKRGPKVLVQYELGTEGSWKKHYDYVKNHFNSPNYMRINGRPVFGIINYSAQIDDMCHYWNQLAINDGFGGIFFIFKYKPFTQYPKDLVFYNYEPHFSAWGKINTITRIKNAIIRRLKIEKEIYLYDYDHVWQDLLKNAITHSDPNFFHGAFVGYDDTPRRGRNRSRVIINQTPDKFEIYLKELIKICKHQNKEFIFLTAWNEWSEGAFLEPDEMNREHFLIAIKKALGEN